VHEYVLVTGLLNESVALGIVEPFHQTDCLAHFFLFPPANYKLEITIDQSDDRQVQLWECPDAAAPHGAATPVVGLTVGKPGVSLQTTNLKLQDYCG
jgi:hypothetical protein